MRRSTDDVRERYELFLIVLLVDRNSVWADTQHVVRFRVEQLLPVVLELGDLLEEPILRRRFLHALAFLVLRYRSLEQIGGLLGGIDGRYRRHLKVDAVGRMDGIVVAGFGLSNQGYQSRDGVPVGCQEPFLFQIYAGVEVELMPETIGAWLDSMNVLTELLTNLIHCLFVP